MLEPGRKNLPGDEVAPKKPPPAPGAAEAFVESTRTVLEQARFFKRDDSFGSLDRKLNEIAAELAASDRSLPTPGLGRGTRPVTANGPIELLAESQNQERELLRLSEKNRSSIERSSRAEQDPDSAMAYVFERWESLKSEEKALENQFGLLESIVTNFSTTGAGATQDELHAASAALIAYSWIITERQISYREIQELGLASRLRFKDDELDAAIAAASESKLSCLDMAARLVRGLTSPTGQQESDSTGSQMPAGLGLDAPKDLVKLVHEMRADIIRGVGAPPEKLQPEAPMQQVSLPPAPMNVPSDEQLEEMILREHPSLAGPDFTSADVASWQGICARTVERYLDEVRSASSDPGRSEREVSLNQLRKKTMRLEHDPALPEGYKVRCPFALEAAIENRFRLIADQVLISGLPSVLIIYAQLGLCITKQETGTVALLPAAIAAASWVMGSDKSRWWVIRDDLRWMVFWAHSANDPVSQIGLAARIANTADLLRTQGLSRMPSCFFVNKERLAELRYSIMKTVAGGIKHGLVEMYRSLHPTATIPDRDKSISSTELFVHYKSIADDLIQLQSEVTRFSRIMDTIVWCTLGVSGGLAFIAVQRLLKGAPFWGPIGGP